MPSWMAERSDDRYTIAEGNDSHWQTTEASVVADREGLGKGGQAEAQHA